MKINSMDSGLAFQLTGSYALKSILLLSLILLPLTGCKINNSLQGSILDGSGAIQAPSLPSQVDGSANVIVDAKGGIPPYTYSLVSGDGAIDPSTGNFIPPVNSSDVTIKIIDSTGEEGLVNLSVRVPIVVSPATKTMTTFSKAQQTFAASGGSGIFTYSIKSGPGTINASTGVYTAPFESGITEIEIIDSMGETSAAIVNNEQALVGGSINDMELDGTDALYVGGYFSTVFPEVKRGFVRINKTTGNLDETFDILQGFKNSYGTAGTVNSIVELPSGGFVIGGSFAEYRGLPAQNIAKISADGSLDTTFNQVTGFSSTVQKVINVGDELIVGGSFTSYRGVAVGRIAKLTLDGEMVTDFNSGVGFDSTVKDMVTDGTSVWVGGYFDAFNGDVHNHIAKLNLSDGTIEATFAAGAGTGFSSYVYSLDYDGTSVFVGGSFSSYDGTAALRIAKIDKTTAILDPVFNTTAQQGFSGYVYDLAVSGGSLFVAGGFTSYQTQTVDHLAKLSVADGSLDTTFTQVPGLSDRGQTVKVIDGSVYVGSSSPGSSTYRGVSAQHLIKLDPTSGNLDLSFKHSNYFSVRDHFVRDIVLDSNDGLLIGGDFTIFGGTPAQNLIKIDLSAGGGLDTTFTELTGPSGTVYDIHLVNTSLYIGGNFSNYRSAPAAYLAKLDTTTGNLDSTFQTAAQPDNRVYTVNASTSDLYIGGSFVDIGGATVSRIAKVNLTSGVLDTTFTKATGFNSTVRGLALNGDASSIFVTGQFTNYKGTGANRLAKLDTTNGNLDGTFSIGTGLNKSSKAIVFDGANSIYVGADDYVNLTTYNGTTVQDLLKINATTGSLDTTFSQATGVSGDASSLILDGSNLYVGGSIYSYRGDTSVPNKAIKLDATSGNSDNSFEHITPIFNVIRVIKKIGDILIFGGDIPMPTA